jgi:leucyl-tRNA synthetase
MMMRMNNKLPAYDPAKIEKKWQKKWAASKLYRSEETAGKKKAYILDMFPYPSGEGLHVGHPKGYIATDIVSRMRRMQGLNVLHPMGFDAFGLPAENYALKMKTNPMIGVAKNVERFKEQLEILGFDYDWSREINTTDPEYYKWTQWIFLRLFKKGLAYESYEPINWCPSCKTGLANEDVEGSRCERCGTPVEKKPMRQWVLKITDYADKLLRDLDAKGPDSKPLIEWPESIKELQRNWIGRSEGALLTFKVKGGGRAIDVFTTRPDTLFGVTYMVVAPEHKLVKELLPSVENKKEVESYIAKAAIATEIERTDMTKDKTGVELRGVKAVNPANNEEVPVWIADYVLADYGTGAVMAVPAHDDRDYAFAKKFGLAILEVIAGGDINKTAYIEDGRLVNSGKFDGKDSQAVMKEITGFAHGKWVTKYKLRDWVFSRQRYWGEPIPIIHCEKCGAVPVPEEDLPVKLPKVKYYEPTGTGESPLAAIDKWVNVKCPKCGGKGKRETNTMPQWAGSSWYYLRYEDPKNDKALVDLEKEKYWSPVDLYVGGAEHATRHLIYARFWHKFLYDIGAVSTIEPFTRLQSVGLIMGEDGRKMSKRFGNIVNPDDIVKTYGADTMRLYEMFMGPFDQQISWNTSSMVGARRFIERVWKLREKAAEVGASDRIIHKTVKKVTEDIENLRFNTAISALMIALNELDKGKSIARKDFESYLKLLAPFAPHVAEELWISLGNKKSIHVSEWPKFDPAMVKDSNASIVVQINGRVRGSFESERGKGKEWLENTAKTLPEAKKWLEGKKIKRIVVVPDKLVNVVTES